MRKIKLTQGKYILVDDDDFEYLSQFKWYLLKIVGYTSYAIRSQNKKTIYLHRDILKPNKNAVVDHLNGDGLDNRRENLRVVSQKENQQNRKSHRSGKLVGVTEYRTKSGKIYYLSFFYHEGKDIYLGCFKTPEDAHKRWKEEEMRLRIKPLKDKNE